MTVFGSGNLAPVYFHFSDNRVTRPELDKTYPGLFDALLTHEGVGVILAYEEDGTPVAWDDKIVLAGASATVREVYCYESATGNLIWKQPCAT